MLSMYFSFARRKIMKNPATPPATERYTLHADRVTAEALAFGKNASASKTVTGLDSATQKALQDAIAQLEQAISQLPLNAGAAAIVKQETQAMTDMVRSGKTQPEAMQHMLHSLKDKLQIAGVVIADVVALAAPVKAIASALRLPLQYFGL
jgi:cystathionine beta-lyase/cystathionine gamma-synthase